MIAKAIQNTESFSQRKKTSAVLRRSLASLSGVLTESQFHKIGLLATATNIAPFPNWLEHQLGQCRCKIWRYLWQSTIHMIMSSLVYSFPAHGKHSCLSVKFGEHDQKQKNSAFSKKATRDDHSMLHADTSEGQNWPYGVFLWTWTLSKKKKEWGGVRGPE